jgi:hypothetical protein
VLSESPGTTIALMLYCSHMSARLACLDCADCPHVLQAHDGHDTSRLGNMYACVGNMHPDYVDRSARLFFILEAHGLQGTA